MLLRDCRPSQYSQKLDQYRGGCTARKLRLVGYCQACWQYQLWGLQVIWMRMPVLQGGQGLPVANAPASTVTIKSDALI